MDLTFRNNKSLYAFLLICAITINLLFPLTAVYAIDYPSPTSPYQYVSIKFKAINSFSSSRSSDTNPEFPTKEIILDTNTNVKKITNVKVYNETQKRDLSQYFQLNQPISNSSNNRYLVLKATPSPQEFVYPAKADDVIVLTYVLSEALPGSTFVGTRYDSTYDSKFISIRFLTSCPDVSCGSTPTTNPPANDTWYSQIPGLSDLKNMVGGWVGDVLGALSTPFTLLADAVSYLGTKMGTAITDLYNSTVNGFKDLSTWLSELGSDIVSGLGDLSTNIGGWFSDLGSDIGGWFTDLGKKFVDSITDLWDSVKDIFSSVTKILNYINPFHKDFFLKVAFIPEDGYFTERFSDLRNDVKARFAFITQIQDALDAVTKAIQTQQFKGVIVKIPFTNKEMNVINTDFINAAAPKMRYFIGGLFVVTTLIYLIRRGGKVIGAGKGG